jgi:hypothetical protein
VTARLLFRTVLVVIVLAAAAIGINWFYFGEPSPESQFFYSGNQVVDLRFSPDGQKLAVVSFEVPPPDSAKVQATRIMRVSDGQLIHVIPHAAWKCDWNSDGTLLATGGVIGTEYDLWETAKWRLKRHLSLNPPAGQKANATNLPSGEEWNPGIVQRLCFNRQGSLFTVSFAQDEDPKSEINHAKIWWDPLAPSAVAESIGLCGGPFDLSVAGSGKNSFVAISYKTPCSPEVEKIGFQAGKIQVESKIALKNLPHELTSPRIELTPDGNILLARDSDHFDLFSLSESTPKLVQSVDSRAPIVKGSLLWYKQVQISRDGRFAVYDTEEHLNVIRLPDGKPVLTITHQPCVVALAPDGSHLAVADQSQHSILFYRVPGGGSGSADASTSPAAQQ